MRALANDRPQHAGLLTVIRVTFGPIGRGRFIPDPIEVPLADDATITEAIVAAAWPYLRSEDVDAVIDWDTMTGRVVVGYVRPVGTFTIEHLTAQVWL